MRGYFFALAISMFFAVFCNDANSDGSSAPHADTIPQNIAITAANLAGNFSTQTVLSADSSIFDQFFNEHPALSNYKKDVQQFYRERHYTMAWHDSSGLIEHAANLTNRLRSLPQEGVSTAAPYLDEADSLTAEMSNDRQVQTKTDYLLTGLYFFFADKVWGGLNESHTRKINWYLPRKELDYTKWLDSLLKIPDLKNVKEPLYRQYRLLLPFLEQYKQLKNWAALTPPKKSYKLGDTGEIFVHVKERLQQLGDLSQNSGSPVFDDALEQAVKNFQHRFGMKEDGVMGNQFFTELNVPPAKRIEQIEVNLERSRWLPYGRTGPYMAVNIPEFRLHAYNGDSLLWSMNVVVGKSVHKTVIFSGELKYVVFSPYWNVPSSILKNEVLPGIRRNKNYLARHHMEWNGNSVRQKPGPWNSLGQVKFLFPNSFSIYLHDTPSKDLFNEDSRAFSHGCIRVAEPKKLAMYLLRNDAAWNEQKIVQAMNSGKEQYVTLKEPVPVYIAYFTAWVDREGKINFRKDIYKRDERLAEMIE